MTDTLLVVDDDVPFTMIIKNSLEKEGYIVLSAHHVNEAKKILDERAPEIKVMLLDWSLPDVTGIDLLREIKLEKSFENIQVIMQTVISDSENIREGIEAGVFFYLVKPVKKELLHSTIKAAILDFERKKDLLKKLEESKRSFRFLTKGEFHFRTVQDGDFLAVRIAHECPNPQEAILISELFSNAVEHGNLGLTYDEKTRLITENRLKEEVELRLLQQEHANQFVHVTFRRLPNKILLTVKDQGRGFDFQKYLGFDDGRVFHNHGRGIALLNSIYNLRYSEKGNKVEVEIPISKTSYN
ncbi:MAG: response regulator [Chitinophagales bacterium]